MRTKFPSTCSRAALAALAMTAVLVAAAPALGQPALKPTSQAAATDLRKFLPPLVPVPWLDSRYIPARNTASPVPQAGSASALLLAPQPAASWMHRASRTASAGTGADYAGM